MTAEADLREAARRWIDADVNESDRAELRGVLSAAENGDSVAAAELRERMSAQLSFGTAGLRGRLRAGPNGMNDAVVIRTTEGVAAWLERHGHSGALVVLGRDARHRSERFAATTAEVLTAAGFDVRVLPRPLPTPVLAFAVPHLGAAAGIQITASHNPPKDNGYKLYDHSGRQIVPPADEQVETAIAKARPAADVPRAHGASTLDERIVDNYVDTVAHVPGGDRELTVVATALHGVGAEVLRTAMARAGFGEPHLVPSQSEPDPDFPTLTRPNPEEAGASDEVLRMAARVDADIAIALDPDADRCAVGVPDSRHTWRMLHGDETGVLLGEYILSTTEHPDPLVATTLVSSSMLSRIAGAHAARYAETLTGFKWLTRAGRGLVYAYEEALGLCVDPATIPDKDGISAAVLACDLAARLRSEGRTLHDMLDELAVRHGVHRTGQLVVSATGRAALDTLMADLRDNPPVSLAGTEVTVEDLLPMTDGLRLAGDDLRVVIRPSGTEPKLKAYLEVRAGVAPPTNLATVRAHAEDRSARLHAELRDHLHTRLPPSG